ncbi:MAG: hypothetical protein WBM46_11450 [Polyangiales bacterium]
MPPDAYYGALQQAGILLVAPDVTVPARISEDLMRYVVAHFTAIPVRVELAATTAKRKAR